MQRRPTPCCSPRALAGLSALALAAAGVIAPRAADAQILSRIAIRGEAGLGASLPDYQSQVLRYGLTVQGSGRVAFSLIDALAVQASFTSWYLPSDLGDGQQYSLTAGLRFEPRVGRYGRAFVDVNAGAGFTGGTTRFTLDAGVGFEFAFTHMLGIGPVVRYGHTFAQANDDYPSDAQFITVGLSATLRGPEPAPVVQAESPADADRDGIPDAQDVCPTEPAGANPDPVRQGCPTRAAADADADGVPDDQDQCPSDPAGANPDPQHPGCPVRDTDGDGVPDPQDQCATEPAGANPDPDRPGCADPDTDHDTVSDHHDQCPRDPAGLHPDPARAGCPLPDRDGDGIPDASDHCPDQVGAPSSDPNRNGCPGLVRLLGTQIRILEQVYFGTNADTILPRSRRVLEAVADALRATPEIRHISIEGHTDDAGDDQRNMGLSQRRAESVMRRLTELGIDASRLEAHGYGETRPVVPVQGLTGRRLRNARGQNRRVEFRITDPAQGDAPAATPTSTTGTTSTTSTTNTTGTTGTTSTTSPAPSTPEPAPAAPAAAPSSTP